MNYATAEAEDNREKILKFIVKYIKRHCYPPATYEIAADTGLSKATVRRHIAMLLEEASLRQNIREIQERIASKIQK